MSRSTRLRRAAVTSAALFGLLGVPGWATAAESGRASGSIAVTSGSWGLVATTAAAAPFGTGPLSLTFPASFGSPPPQFFWGQNTGSLGLSGSTWSASATVGTATVASCSGTWNETADTCSGTITTVVVSTSSPSSAGGVAPAVGAHTRLRCLLNVGIGSFGSTVTIGTSVSRAQARSPVTTST